MTVRVGHLQSKLLLQARAQVPHSRLGLALRFLLCTARRFLPAM